MPNYRAVAAQDARRYGIPVNVFLKQIQMESGFNPNARSGAGALGIAQFMPGTARSHGLANPMDPVAALDAAAKFDAQLFSKYGVAGGLSAYNSGRPDAYKDPNFAHGQTYNYVRNIMGGANPAAPVGAVRAPQQPSAQQQAIARPAGPDPNMLKQKLAQLLMGAAQTHGPQDFSPILSMIRQRDQALAQPRPAAPLPVLQPRPVATGASSQQNTPGADGKPSLGFLLPFATKYGLTVTSTTGGKHAVHSYHYQGRAVDYGGDPSHMARLYAYALAHPQQFREAFYTGPGAAAYFVKNGRVLPISQLDPGLRAEHQNHVHLAH